MYHFIHEKPKTPFTRFIGNTTPCKKKKNPTLLKSWVYS